MDSRQKRKSEIWLYLKLGGGKTKAELKIEFKDVDVYIAEMINEKLMEAHMLTKDYKNIIYYAVGKINYE